MPSVKVMDRMSFTLKISTSSVSGQCAWFFWQNAAARVSSGAFK